jgi:hypothetical protein
MPAIKRRVRIPHFLIAACVLSFAPRIHAAGLDKSESRFSFRDTSGRVFSTHVVRHFWRTRILHPFAKVDPSIDPKLRRAATIAQERANAHSKARCWQYVKDALLAAGAVGSYPKTAYAAQAGEELVRSYGFHKLSGRDPYAAPIGAVLVYGGRGHVEIRTKDGFVSDYHSNNACFYPLLAIYGKSSS